MTGLEEALFNVTKLGFDTAPFIYLVERHPKYIALVRESVRLVDTGALAGFSSVITLTEVLTQPKRLGNSPVESEYRDLLLHSRNFYLVPVDASVAEQAADLRARHNLRTPDALQIAAALSAGCQAFLTNNAALARVKELRVLLLDELEV